MVSQWKEDIVRFTYLAPTVHFGKEYLDRVTYNNIMRGPRPWRTVIISSPDVFLARYQPRNAGQQQLWGPDVIDRVVIDEFHRLRSSGLGQGEFVNHTTGGIVKIDDDAMPEKLARSILALKPKFKWALTATPLVSSLDDCVCETPFDGMLPPSANLCHFDRDGSCASLNASHGWTKICPQTPLSTKKPWS